MRLLKNGLKILLCAAVLVFVVYYGPGGLCADGTDAAGTVD